MGRGLSPLQRTMLELALRNHDAEGRAFDQDAGADAYVPEVYVAAYGWHRGRQWAARGVRAHWIKADPPPGQGHGAAARAAVARAARRLEARGLVRRVYNAWSGIDLTPEGYEVAKGLSVKPAEILPAT